MRQEERAFMPPFIVSYQDAVPLGPGIVGGKGWNLSRLHRYGFLVPKGGILSAPTYTQFMHTPELRGLYTDLADVGADNVADPRIIDILHTLRETITATAFPTEVENAVQMLLDDFGLADTLVAVRSSAKTEDSAVASFAGIHE